MDNPESENSALVIGAGQILSDEVVESFEGVSKRVLLRDSLGGECREWFGRGFRHGRFGLRGKRRRIVNNSFGFGFQFQSEAALHVQVFLTKAVHSTVIVVLQGELQ